MLLSVKDLQVRFLGENKEVYHAVNGISFDVEAGESVGIVGESGCGKSVSCYALLQLLNAQKSEIQAEEILFQNSIKLNQLSTKELRKFRGRAISWIFQDPMTALTPWKKILSQVAEPLIIHGMATRKEALNQAKEALLAVGIEDANRYPHEFSGGMRQRALIAMALITCPALLIADEPTTALDVSLQKQILDLIENRRKETSSAMMLISHDLDVVAHYCQKIMVMYAGEIVEIAPATELISRPCHAYTAALLQAMPTYAEKGKELFCIQGLPPKLTNEPKGCSFSPRNTLGNPEKCTKSGKIPLVEVSPNHWVKNCPGCRLW